MTDAPLWAFATTVEGYGDPDVTVTTDNDSGAVSGVVLAARPLPACGQDADTSEQALDAALAALGYARTGPWEPAPFGSLAPVRAAR